jgi:hypothetical protein
MHGRICSFLVVALLALAAPAAAAASNDDMTTPTRMFYGPASAQAADLASTSTQAGEPATKWSPGGCAMFTHTAWWTIRGNGGDLVLSVAGSEVGVALAVYDPGTGSPANDNRIACAARLDPSGAAATRITRLARDHLYRVQVGTPGNTACSDPDQCADIGRVRLAAEGVPRPPDDHRADADRLTTGVPFQRDNTGATLEAGEPDECGGVPYSATVWFRWSAPDAGVARFEAAASFPNVTQSGDTVLAVYRAADGALLGCDDDAAAPHGPSALALPVAPGDLLLQVGARGAEGSAVLGQGTITALVGFAPDRDRDDDGYPLDQDCDDADPARHPGAFDVPDDGVDQDCDGVAAVDLDRDDDHVTRPQDCRDDDPRIHPGAVDVPQDGVDEDCAGGDAPYPDLGTTIQAAFRPRAGGYLTFTLLRVVRARAGSRLVVRCARGGCPFTRKVRRFRRNARKLDLTRLVRGVRLRARTTVTVRVTRPRTIGVQTTFRGRGPSRTDRCLPPGAKRPRRC